MIKGPAINYDKNKFLKKPKIIKRINVSEQNDYQDSLFQSVKFFLDTTNKKKNFPKKENTQSLKVNNMIL